MSSLQKNRKIEVESLYSEMHNGLPESHRLIKAMATRNKLVNVC